MSHSPLPWKFESDYPSGRQSVCDADGRHVASMSMSWSKGQKDGPFIVRAVNCYEPLLEVCEAIAEDIGYGGGGAKLSIDFTRRLHAAIAKAKEAT